MNYSQQDLNKVSKYAIRLRKSIITNNSNQIEKYYKYLKFHIQSGGINNDELDEKTELLDNIISNLSKTKSNISFDELNKKLKTCNDNNDKLEKEKKKLTIDLQENLTSVNKISEIEKLNIEQLKKISELNKNIEELQQKSKDNESSDVKLQNIRTIIKEILNKSDDLSDDLEQEKKELIKKITKYNDIIIKIKEHLNINDFENDDKLNDALNKIELKLKNSQYIENALINTKHETDKLNQKIKLLEQKTNDLSNIKHEKNNLEKINKDLENENNNLKNENKELIEDKKLNDEKINSFISEFDSKLNNMLMQIYGNKTIVDNIIQGTRIDDKTK